MCDAIAEFEGSQGGIPPTEFAAGMRQRVVEAAVPNRAFCRESPMVSLVLHAERGLRSRWTCLNTLAISELTPYRLHGTAIALRMVCVMGCSLKTRLGPPLCGAVPAISWEAQRTAGGGPIRKAGTNEVPAAMTGFTPENMR